MSLVTQARPAAPLNVSTNFQIIRNADTQRPCTLAISGGSDFQLRTFRVIATGLVDVTYQPGLLELSLLGLANQAHAEAPSLDPADWISLATNPAEQIGGGKYFPHAQWLLQGVRMMFSLATGNLQGEYTFNMANPQPAMPLDNPLTGLVRDIDPLCYFAIAARFTPDDPPLAAPHPVVQLAHFQLGSEI